MNDPEVAALKATVQAQAREIRDLKTALSSASEANAEAIHSLTTKLEGHITAMQPVLVSSTALMVLLQESHQRKGMEELGKKLVGWGLFGAIGAAAMGIYQFFATGGGQ